MQIEVRVQYTRWTTWAYDSGSHVLEETDWRTDESRHWTFLRPLTDDEIGAIVDSYVNAIKSVDVNYHGAFVRLKVTFTETTYEDEVATIRIVDGKRSQEKKDVPNRSTVVDSFISAQLKFRLGHGLQVVPGEKLPELDATPVPTGTVVEVLDEWGLPTGSTEVT